MGGWVGMWWRESVSEQVRKRVAERVQYELEGLMVGW